MKEKQLYKCLYKRYNAGAKTLVMNREEAEIVLSLLRKKDILDRAASTALKILQQNKDQGPAEAKESGKGETNAEVGSVVFKK